jgi:hypothetical protein
MDPPRSVLRIRRTKETYSLIVTQPRMMMQLVLDMIGLCSGWTIEEWKLWMAYVLIWWMLGGLDGGEYMLR